METGVPQRDSRVWLHPKRRLACPLRRLPMKPNGPRQRRRMDVPRRGTLLRSDQYANCAKRHSVSSTEAKPWALCLTRMRVNVQEEKRKHGITCHTSSPWRRGAPKAQDGSTKRYERQWSGEGLVASDWWLVTWDLGLECCFRASPPSLLTREQSIDSQSKSDTPLGRTLNPETSSLLKMIRVKHP